jgi:hypothetical protein
MERMIVFAVGSVVGAKWRTEGVLMVLAAYIGFCYLRGMWEAYCADKRQEARIASAESRKPIDYSISQGDTVYSSTWGDGTDPLEVIDVNWALGAIAVRLSMNGMPGSITVWPADRLSKTKGGK